MSEENKTFMAIVEIDGVREEREVVEVSEGFDAMTGEPIKKFKVKSGFDAMTGEPTMTEVEADGFDGETGKQVFKAKTEAAGAGIAKAAENAAASVANVAEAAGEAVNKAAKSNALPIVAVIGAAVIAIVALLVIVFKSGVFTKPADKVALAIAKTVEQDTICGTLIDAGEILGSDALTMSVKGSANVEGFNMDITGELAQDAAKGQASFNADVDISGLTEQKIEFYYDDSKVQFAIPEVYGKTFEYNYKGKNKGYLAELIEDETEGDIEDLNKVLSTFSDMYKKSPKYRKELQSELLKVYRGIEVKKGDKETFEINDKDVKCQGYVLTITGEDVAKMAQVYVDVTKKVYGDSVEECLEAVGELTGEDLDMDDIWDEFDIDMDDIEDLDEEVEINFYIYKGMLAAIEFEVDDEEISIQFQGGDTRTSNIKCVYDDGNDKQILKRKSSVDGTKEKGSVSMDGVELVKYNYDTKSGKFEVTPSFGSSINGVFKVESGKKVTLECDGRIEGNNIDLTFDVTKGAKIKELNTKKVFDLGNADEDDFEDLVYDLSGELSYLDYMF